MLSSVGLLLNRFQENNCTGHKNSFPTSRMFSSTALQECCLIKDLYHGIFTLFFAVSACVHLANHTRHSEVVFTFNSADEILTYDQ